MKLGPVTKLDKRNTTMSKNDDGVMSVSYDVIVIFSIYDQFGAIPKPDCRRMVCNFYIFLIATFYLKTELKAVIQV